MTTNQYVYKVKAVEKVTDGDTFWLHLDVGFRETELACIRLDGYDCPELRSGSDFEKQKGIEARDATASFFAKNIGYLWCQTEKDPDNFGRWLGKVWFETENVILDLGQWLELQELATIWPERWHERYDPTYE